MPKNDLPQTLGDYQAIFSDDLAALGIIVSPVLHAALETFLKEPSISSVMVFYNIVLESEIDNDETANYLAALKCFLSRHASGLANAFKVNNPWALMAFSEAFISEKIQRLAGTIDAKLGPISRDCGQKIEDALLAFMGILGELDPNVGTMPEESLSRLFIQLERAEEHLRSQYQRIGVSQYSLVQELGSSSSKTVLHLKARVERVLSSLDGIEENVTQRALALCVDEMTLMMFEMNSQSKLAPFMPVNSEVDQLKIEDASDTTSETLSVSTSEIEQLKAEGASDSTSETLSISTSDLSSDDEQEELEQSFSNKQEALTQRLANLTQNIEEVCQSFEARRMVNIDKLRDKVEDCALRVSAVNAAIENISSALENSEEDDDARTALNTYKELKKEYLRARNEADRALLEATQLDSALNFMD